MTKFNDITIRFFKQNIRIILICLHELLWSVIAFEHSFMQISCHYNSYKFYNAYQMFGYYLIFSILLFGMALSHPRKWTFLVAITGEIVLGFAVNQLLSQLGFNFMYQQWEVWLYTIPAALMQLIGICFINRKIRS